MEKEFEAGTAGTGALSAATSAGGMNVNKKTVGIVMLVVGVLGLIIVYSMRPPSGIGDALNMLAQGKQNFIKEPYYEILMVVSAVVAVFGVVKIVQGQKRGADK